MLEDSLVELLTSTPNIPLADQLDQFRKEYSTIMDHDRLLQSHRIKAAQAVATEGADSVKQSVENNRQQYRQTYAPPTTHDDRIHVPGRNPNDVAIGDHQLSDDTDRELDPSYLGDAPRRFRERVGNPENETTILGNDHRDPAVVVADAGAIDRAVDGAIGEVVFQSDEERASFVKWQNSDSEDSGVFVGQE